MKQGREWPGDWTEHIGKAVARHRKQKGLSAQALSDRCAEMGFRIPRNTITNLENGRKESVPVHEMWLLARALDVAAIDLLFPLTFEGGVVPDLDERLEEGAWILRAEGKADSQFRLYERHAQQARVVASREDAWACAYSASDLHDTRRTMESEGMPLPEVPPEVAWWLESDTLDGLPRHEKFRRQERVEMERRYRVRAEANDRALREARRRVIDEMGHEDG